MPTHIGIHLREEIYNHNNGVGEGESLLDRTKKGGGKSRK